MLSYTIMPELPEVETIASQMQKELPGNFITAVSNHSDYRTQPNYQTFEKSVKDRSIMRVERAAKTISIFLDSEKTIVFHLAMTGRLLLRKPGTQPDSWHHLTFHLQKADEKSELRFADARVFGFVRLLDPTEMQAHKDRYALDPLNQSLQAADLLKNLQKRRTVVKRALLEQDLVAGVGNIYASEALYLSKIHPETLTGALTTIQTASLLNSLRAVLQQSLKHRGSTLNDGMYVDLYGRPGEHQNYLKVFNRAGKPCPVCAAEIEMKTIGGRSTFFCPNCQQLGPKPKPAKNNPQTSFI